MEARKVEGKIEQISRASKRYKELYTAGIRINGIWYNSPPLSQKEAEEFFKELKAGDEVEILVEEKKAFKQVVSFSKSKEEPEVAELKEVAQKEEVELLRECIQIALDAWKPLKEKIPEQIFWSEVANTARAIYIENKRRLH